jgi:hypothetical protein
MVEAVARVGGSVALEASGGINLDTVRAIAEAGVDRISIGALTHSVAALDIADEGDRTPDRNGPRTLARASSTLRKHDEVVR